MSIMEQIVEIFKKGGASISTELNNLFKSFSSNNTSNSSEEYSDYNDPSGENDPSWL